MLSQSLPGATAALTAGAGSAVQEQLRSLLEMGVSCLVAPTLGCPGGHTTLLFNVLSTMWKIINGLAFGAFHFNS